MTLTLMFFNLRLSSFLFPRFGVSQTSEGSSRSSLENGGREQDCGSESDEEAESESNTSDTGRHSE